MNNMLENYQKKTSSSNEKKDSIINPNILQDIHEESIWSYAIQNPQNIYDENFEQILTVLEFSIGLNTHQIALAPDGLIRWISEKFPVSLLQEIHNALVAIVVFDAPEENE